MFKIPILLLFIIAITLFSFGASCVPQPYIYVTYFDVLPSPINAGEEATLHWNVTGANSVVIDNGIGEVPPYGKAPLKPLETTTYSLTAKNETRTVMTTAKLIVTTPSVKIPLTSTIPTLSALDSTELLRYLGKEVDVKGKVTYSGRWRPADQTDIWTSIYFCENAAQGGFPGSGANGDPLDYTSYFRAIVKPQYYNTFYDYSYQLIIQPGNLVTIHGIIEAYKAAPVIFLKSASQLSVVK